MQALVVTPGTAGSTRVSEVPDVRAGAGEVLLRPLEIGVCGTDSEISAGLFGVAPDGEPDLILGHELLAEVVETGELVAATVRRSCGRCAACAAGSPDACLTGGYLERGITRLHGFASELAVEAPANLVPIPRKLGRLGVLAEPASVTSRAIRHALAIGRRQVWEPERALVLGAGAIGMLATFFLRLEGFDVCTASLEPPGSEKAELVEAVGARYGLEEEGGFDLVVEAAGSAELMVEAIGLLRRNGVACLLGIDAHHGTVPVERRVLGLDAVIQNRAVFGSVNAHRDDWTAGVERLTKVRTRWPDAAERLVGLRVDPDRFHEAFEFPGVKATVQFG